MMTSLNVLRFLGATAFLTCVAVTHAAGTPTSADSAESRYVQDRQACLAGETQQSRDVCLREAGAARDAARTGALQGSSKGEKANNAVERCDVFTNADSHAACLDRVRGAGNQSGSALQGGVLRESTTTTTTVIEAK